MCGNDPTLGLYPTQTVTFLCNPKGWHWPLEEALNLSPSSPLKTRHRLHQQRTSLGPVQDPHSPLQRFQSLGKPRSRQSSSRSRGVGMASSSSAVQYDFWLIAVFVLFSCLLMFYVKQSLWIDLIISGRILGFHDEYIS